MFHYALMLPFEKYPPNSLDHLKKYHRNREDSIMESHKLDLVTKGPELADCVWSFYFTTLQPTTEWSASSFIQ